MKNTGKYVLLTGGTSGIGYELAKLFAADQYNLILVARNQDELGKVAAELSAAHGVEVLTLSKDLFDPQVPLEIYNEINEKGIKPDVLVNDAGQGVYGKFIENDLKRELAIIQLNIGATVMLTKFFLKDMVSRGSGKILNVASVAGKIPGPWQAVYHGTKAFVHSFNEAVNNEIKDTGVTLTSLLPGPTDTDFFHKADMEDAKIVKEGKLMDAAAVAKDGYEAMQAGKDMIVTGLKNKLQVAMGNITPDNMLAENLSKAQEPAGEEHR